MPVETYSFGGVSQAQFDALAAKLNLNRVKIPTPTASDYTTPSGVSASSENTNILLEDFEDVSDWAYTENDPSGVFSGQQITGWNTEGTYSYQIAAAAGGATGNYAQISKTIDLTNLGILVFDAQIGYGSELGGKRYAQMLIDDTVVWQKDTTSQAGEFLNQTIDIANYTGEHEIKFRFILYQDSPTQTSTFQVDNLRYGYPATLTIDDKIATGWMPNPPDESGAWIRWDLGAGKIVGACRIYWGADANYRPSAYRIQVSEDASNWTTVYTATTQPSSGWVEYTWSARYCRYIRLLIDAHGASGTEVYEFDYYSRLTDKVACEHGHE